MAGGDVEHLEVVVVQLHFRPFYDAEAHGHERGADFADDLRGGMQPSGDHGPAGEGNVQRAGGGQFGLGQLADASGYGFFQDVLGLVGGDADGTPELGFQLGYGAEQPGDLAAPAQPGDAPLFGAVGVAHGVQFGQGLAGQL